MKILEISYLQSYVGGLSINGDWCGAIGIAALGSATVGNFGVAIFLGAVFLAADCGDKV